MSIIGKQSKAVAIATIGIMIEFVGITAENPYSLIQKAYALTFSATKNLSNNAGALDKPQIAKSGSNVYVAWWDQTTGSGDIYFKRSTDGGSTFGRLINLSNNAEESSWPKIAVSRSDVYIVWVDQVTGNGDIYFKRSTDGGSTFSATKNLSNNAGASEIPQIAVSGGNVYVVWDDSISGTSQVFYKRSTDGGSTFGSTRTFSTSPEFEASGSQLAVSGYNVYAIWSDSSAGNGDILLKASTDNGATFGSSRNLSNDAGGSSVPQIVVSGSTIYTVWSDTTAGKGDIFFKKSS